MHAHSHGLKLELNNILELQQTSQESSGFNKPKKKRERNKMSRQNLISDGWASIGEEGQVQMLQEETGVNPVIV